MDSKKNFSMSLQNVSQNQNRKLIRTVDLHARRGTNILPRGKHVAESNIMLR